MAREHIQEFAAYIGSRQSVELRKEARGLERELAALKKRSKELDSIFKRLYEDSVLGGSQRSNSRRSPAATPRRWKR